MKKTLILLLLLTIITCSIITCSSLVFAETYDQTIFYEATKNIEVYYENISTPVIIPYTYYFKITGADENFIHILYNGENLLLKKEDYDSKVKKTNLTEIVSPYYNIEIPTKETQTDVYFTLGDDTHISMVLTNISFIGYTTYGGENYLFIKTTIGSNQNTHVYINANEIFENYDPSKIVKHPNSQAAKDEIRDQETRLAQNKLKRNFFFFFICALCILVVVLIYNPFRKKGAIKAPSSFSSEDDF